MISTVDHRQTPLLDALQQQGLSPHHRYYMPGHKGGKGSPGSLLQTLGQSLRFDLPELPGMDQLFAPEGVIAEAQALAAHACGAEKSFFLVNGSSGGLIAAILAVCSPDEAIIVPRNCHQSIIHGLILSGAHPIWIEPPVDPLSGLVECIHPQQLQKTLEKYPKAKGVIAVSPTYDGICGDVKELAAIAHRHQIPLIIDEAHGAHFHFHSQLPPSALEQGADLAVQSWHKVLGSLSQASVLHMQGSRINPSRLQNALTMIQSSSPNYLLLASLDAARQQMALYGAAIFEQSLQNASRLKQSLKALTSIQVLALSPRFLVDPLRLTLLLQHSPLSGFELDERLTEEFNIIAELPKKNSLTFVLGQGNTAQELNALYSALCRVDQRYAKVSSQDSEQPTASPFEHGRLSQIPPRQTLHHPSQKVPREQALGKICAVTICPYPPGIPLLFPGEKVTEAALQKLDALEKSGCQVIGCDSTTIEIMLPRQE